MKIQLLIATIEKDYANHLSRILTEKHGESFEVTVCSLPARLEGLLSVQAFDVALVEPAFLHAVNKSKIKLPLLLWDSAAEDDMADGFGRIQKYQRVSRINDEILALYAEAATAVSAEENTKRKVTAVWSPAGGSGKTTVALAYAARQAAADIKVTYLDLEFFSSTPVFFQESGKSISEIFGSLDGDTPALLQAIVLTDAESGITYFAPPDDYNDINELTVHDIETLISALEDISDELVIDLPGACDERVRAVIEKADTVFVVTDGSKTSIAKIQQFTAQHDLFEKICEKAILVANKSAKYSDDRFSHTINLPLLSPNDPVLVYKTLSGLKILNFELYQ